ncbi:hypothetical protein ACGGAQ_12600 [Micromonospora sp. NPDC047557]
MSGAGPGNELNLTEPGGDLLFAVNQPEGVDVNHLVVRPAGQVN